ncbi:MAG: hypothetical protein P8Y38_00480 [Deltaproteobacteria bacterium]
MDGKLSAFIENYIQLEKHVRQRVDSLSHGFCADCAGDCCREEICRESLISPFLALLTSRQRIPYDGRRGWLGPSGCRLAYGRPTVCYDFFCRWILDSPGFKTAGIQKIIHGFVAVGKKAHGNTQLMCIEDLNILSPRKIEKMNQRACALLKRAQTTLYLDRSYF